MCEESGDTSRILCEKTYEFGDGVKAILEIGNDFVLFRIFYKDKIVTREDLNTLWLVEKISEYSKENAICMFEEMKLFFLKNINFEKISCVVFEKYAARMLDDDFGYACFIYEKTLCIIIYNKEVLKVDDDALLRYANGVFDSIAEVEEVEG